MILKVLLDNNTLIDRYFFGEPGVSYLIETEGKKVLFDVGYSDAFIKNAFKMGENLRDIDFLGISHGHVDHTWGINYLISMYMEFKGEMMSYKKPIFLSHPEVFNSKMYDDNLDIGFLSSKEILKRHFTLNLTKKPFWISDKLVFLGEIPRKNEFESKNPVGKVLVGDRFEPDYMIDDTAFAYISKKGLVIISGCSHAGICNIIEYSKKVTGIDKIFDVIGGFHLQNPSEHVLSNTVDYLSREGMPKIHPCHCTDLKSKISIAQKLNIEEVGSGMVLEYE